MVATGGGGKVRRPGAAPTAGNRKTHRAATVGSIRKRRQEIFHTVRCVRGIFARARAQTRGKSATVALLDENAICKGFAE
jgi:hypothetical protein